MKPSQDRDFAVNVRHQVREEDPAVAAYYQGVYGMTLNRLVTIVFVPAFSRGPGTWPPVLPDDLDQVGSAQDARRFSVALADYAVTPDEARAGTEEVLPPQPAVGGGGDSPGGGETGGGEDSLEPRPAVVFFVSPAEFDAFTAELEALEDRAPGVHDVVRVPEIEGLEVVKFLRSRVLASPHVAPEHRRVLGLSAG
jgi:hypothetical protein